MSRRPLVAAVLSLVIPGLGQMYAGKGERGALILIGVIIVGNLNAIWLSLFALGGPDAPFHLYTLPRILHDVFAAYGTIFWLWQVWDAYRQAEQSA